VYTLLTDMEVIRGRGVTFHFNGNLIYVQYGGATYSIEHLSRPDGKVYPKRDLKTIIKRGDIENIVDLYSCINMRFYIKRIGELPCELQ